MGVIRSVGTGDQLMDSGVEERGDHPAVATVETGESVAGDPRRVDAREVAGDTGLFFRRALSRSRATGVVGTGVAGKETHLSSLRESSPNTRRRTGSVREPMLMARQILGGVSGRAGVVGVDGVRGPTGGAVARK